MIESKISLSNLSLSFIILPFTFTLNVTEVVGILTSLAGPNKVASKKCL